MAKKFTKRSTRYTAIAATLLAVLVGAPPATAGKPGSPQKPSCPLPPTDLCTSYVTRGYRWSSMPIPYYVNLMGAPLGAERDIHDAFLTWQNEVKSAQVEQAYPGDRSTVSFVYMGVTAAVDAVDGKNVVYFRSCSGCGAASTNKRVRGKLNTEFDIFFNASRTWATDASCPAHDCPALDLQGVATHEIGHALDLYHPTGEGASSLTMYGTEANTFSQRDLGAGDVLGLRALYP